MNVFFCGLRLDGGAISKRELFAPLARLPRHNDWVNVASGAFSASAFGRHSALRPLLAQFRTMFGAGDVRLDNRTDLLALAGIEDLGISDLEVVLAVLDRRGPDVIPRILGDFAFVAWDARAQRLMAARDAFGVKPLYYRRTPEHLLLSSRLEPLSGDEQIDRDYIADFLVGQPSAAPLTIWQGTLAVQPGGVLVQRGSVTAQTRYWSPEDFQPAAVQSEEAATERFRELFGKAVQQRIAAGQTWSQLSGGLDSSAVVSTAEWLRESQGGAGLSGTVTVADSLGSGDESQYCDAVNTRYGVANEVVRDYWPWRNDYGLAPRATDEPSPLFPFFARDQRMVDLVAAGGGRVLLSGLGSDHYMFGTLAYLADMFARGQLRAGAREVLGWAIQTRRSFWHTARLHVLDPLISNTQRHHALVKPKWLRGDFVRQQHVLDRLAEARSPRARIGHLYTTHTAAELRRVASWVQRGPFQDRVETRYPFLSRPLVEFTLQLPISMRVRPEGRKWILRQAMRGILPEAVRTRQGKGGIDARILWTFQHERRTIEALTADPILGQLGCVDVDELSRTVELARQGEWRNTAHLFSVLGLESWLRARSGTWPMEAAATQTAA